MSKKKSKPEVKAVFGKKGGKTMIKDCIIVIVKKSKFNNT